MIVIIGGDLNDPSEPSGVDNLIHILAFHILSFLPPTFMPIPFPTPFAIFALKKIK